MPKAGSRRLAPFLVVLLGAHAAGTALAQAAREPVTLTLMVAMTPQELASFRPALAAVDDAHPEFVVELEPVPQGAFTERANARLAAGTLPDVVRVEGLSAQALIRRGALLDLAAAPGFDAAVLDDYFPGVLEPFRWQGATWALPDTASPDVLFYDKAAFDEAGLAYPTDDWTFEDMRQAAIRLGFEIFRGVKPLNDLGDNGMGVFRAGIVRGHDCLVRMFPGNACHYGTFALIAVASAAKHGDNAARLELFQGRKNVFQSVGSLREINIGHPAASAGNAFQPSGNLREASCGRDHCFQRQSLA